MAAQQLYQLYAKAAYNSLLRLGLQEALAQDLLQESFIKAFSQLEQLQEARAFGAWLKRIAINLGLQEIRKQKQWLSLEEIPEAATQTEEENEAWPALSFAELKAALDQIPKGCRLIFELYYLEQYSHQEIASELQVTVSTSKSQLHYAKRLLRKTLKVHYET